MTSNNDFCADLRQRIEDAYEESGNNRGWRLLASPASVLDGADIAFIGLNPAGSFHPDEHPDFAPSSGSAYVDEIWPPSKEPGAGRLQRQVRALFAGLSVEPERVLAGNFVPFRSPNWNCLKNPKPSLQFGKLLWRDILERVQPSLVIGMGVDLVAPLTEILGAGEPDNISVCWRDTSARKAAIPNGSLVVLPHLSTYRIVKRKKSAGAMRELFGNRWRG